MEPKTKKILLSVLSVLFAVGMIGCSFADGFIEGLESLEAPTQAVTEEPATTEPVDRLTDALLPTEGIIPTAEPTTAPLPSAQPTDTPVPAVTSEPTRSPVPTNTPVPTIAPTTTPKLTATPKPTKIPTSTTKPTKAPVMTLGVSDIPAYSDKAYIEVFNNKPSFAEEDISEQSFESYSKLDKLGRCGVAFANIGKDLRPEGERGEIGMIKPAGWHTVKYDIIEDLFLYNRCHVIGWQLTGENDNERNLITGTRYMNVEGMLPFENKVANYIRSTGNHVLYRVTPIYDGNNLLCAGIQIEALSVEDNGRGISFNVFCYNVQPGIVIDYATGDSYQELVKTDTPVQEEEVVRQSGMSYVLNTNTQKFHYPSCSSVSTIKDKNRDDFTGDRQELINRGYDPCKRCYP